MGIDADPPDGALSESDPAVASGPDSVLDTDAKTAEAGLDTRQGDDPAESAPPTSSLRVPALCIVLIVIALGGLTTYLGVRSYHSHRQAEERSLFLQVARQGAINLTTIDWEHADADIQRILSSAAGPFFDDFSQRAQPFVDVVKQAQSKSVGTVTEAGMESFSGDQAQILVSVSVTTANLGAPASSPRNWRMRMSVEKVGDEAKVSEVQFVP